MSHSMAYVHSPKSAFLEITIAFGLSYFTVPISGEKKGLVVGFLSNPISYTQSRALVGGG